MEMDIKGGGYPDLTHQRLFIEQPHTFEHVIFDCRNNLHSWR